MSDGNAPISLRQALMGGALEATSGTAETVTTALANTNVYNAKMGPMDLFSGGESRPIGNYGGSDERTIGPRAGKATFRTELRYGDATMTLLQASGFSYAAGPPKVATAVWIDLASAKTITLVLWQKGKKKTLYGASCSSCKIAPESNGQRVYIEWEFMGVWGGQVDASMPSDATITTPALRSAGITLTEDAEEIPQVSEWSIDLGPETNPRQDATAATALHRYQVEDGNPTLSLDPEARLVAQYDAYGLLLAGGTHAIVLTLTDGPGNSISFSMPRAQRLTVEDGERDKKLTDPVTFELHKGSSHGGIVITETAAA